VTAPPEVLVPLRKGLWRTPRVGTYTAGRTRASDLARIGRTAGVRRPWQAGREPSQNLGGPLRSWDPRQAGDACDRERPPDAAGES
jgi:hypothetical protein